MASPGLAVYSRSPTHLERIAGPVDGVMVLAAGTTVLDRLDCVALLERARAEIHGLTITELCDAKGSHRGRFYKRTDAVAERVAAYPQQTRRARSGCGAGRGNRARRLKGGQKAANGEKYGCIATRCLKNNQRKSNDAARRPSGKCRTEEGHAEQGFGSSAG